jgi:hypothetical protein
MSESSTRAELGTPAYDLRLYTERRGAWTKIDADFYPPLQGEAAQQAAELVLEGAEATIATGRRKPFWVSLGASVAEIPSTAEGREAMLTHLYENAGRSASIFTTFCPEADAERLIAGFRKIAVAA